MNSMMVAFWSFFFFLLINDIIKREKEGETKKGGKS